MSLAAGQVLLHLPGRRHRVVDAVDVYYLEAQGDETDVRLRGAGRLRDIRSLGEVTKDLAALGFVRIHRNHAVNPGRVQEIRGPQARSGRPGSNPLSTWSCRSAGSRWRLSSRPIARPRRAPHGRGGVACAEGTMERFEDRRNR